MEPRNCNLETTVDEGLCANCAHKDVCKYREDYREAKAAVNKLTEEKEWAVDIHVLCKYHTGVLPSALR